MGKVDILKYLEREPHTRQELRTLAHIYDAAASLETVLENLSQEGLGHKPDTEAVEMTEDIISGMLETFRTATSPRSVDKFLQWFGAEKAIQEFVDRAYATIPNVSFKGKLYTAGRKLKFSIISKYLPYSPEYEQSFTPYQHQLNDYFAREAEKGFLDKISVVFVSEQEEREMHEGRKRTPEKLFEPSPGIEPAPLFRPEEIVQKSEKTRKGGYKTRNIVRRDVWEPPQVIQQIQELDNQVIFGVAANEVVQADQVLRFEIRPALEAEGG